jgi:putative transposase
MPVTHRRAIRTTNLLERLFVADRRRLKIIPNAFGERPVLKLMGGAMTRAADRWRSIRFTECERRQIAAVRKDLDKEYKAADTTSAASKKARSLTELSSTSQT